MKPSRIYFIQCQAPTGPIKIGHARDVERRRSNLQMGCPYQLTILASYPVHDAPAAEMRLQEVWHHLHLRGEWYRSDPDLLAAIASIETDAERVARVLGADRLSTERRRP